MKNKIFKILGVAVTLAMVLTLAAAFSAPVAASPDETINEWYTFDYPVEGEDGDWFYDPSITALGPIAEAINGDLYIGVGPESELSEVGGGTADWTTDEAHSGSNSVKLTAPTSSDYGKVTLLVTAPFSTFSAPSFYYRIGSDAVATTEDIGGTWPIYVRLGDTVALGYLSPYPVIHISDGITDHWIVGQPWAEDTQVGWTLWDNSQASGHWSDACWHNESFTDLAGGPVDAGWEPLSAWQTNYAGYNVVDVGIGLGFFAVTGQQSAYVDDLIIGSITYDLEPSGEPRSHLFKSTDGARTWSETEYAGGAVVDMVCSSIDEDILYVTDGNYVYKTTDGGDEWDFVARDSLEEQLNCACGNDITGEPITSIDVAYDDDDNPFVFIGTRDVGVSCPPDVEGDVYYIGEAGYPANWTSLNLPCFHGGGYDALAVGCAPDWADTKETYVVVTTDNDGIDGEDHTWVVYTKGTICGWYEFAELLWDCDEDNNFESWAASRIGFPDDWEDTETLFVGIVDEDGCGGGDGGDVYLATDGSAIDLNVEGIITGCQGKESVDIISLDVEGDTDEARLIAGAFCNAHVYCSEDGGWSWDESDKDPTGMAITYVLWYEDTALAATAGCECAVSMCCGEDYPCEFWNQISLISTDIDCVNWIDHSPGYLSDDSKTMFMITCSDCYGQEQGPCPSTASVFRHDGTYWERVFCSTVAGADEDTPPYHTFRRIQVSPDFLTTNAVFVWNGCFEMWRSLDAGCSWDKLTFPCAPRPCIREAVVIDEDTVIAGGWCCWLCDCDGAQGKVYKTTRHGARPWQEYEYETTDPGNVISFALEPGYEEPGSVLLGDTVSRVYISEDGGETWDLVGDCQTVFDSTEPAYVVFDPGYATNHTIYAAADSIIARCIIDPDEDWADQEWEVLCDGLGYASGIKAAGDTALYVADEQPLPDTGVLRSLNPDAEDVGDVVFEQLIEELDPYAELWGLWLTTDVSDEGCTENVLWSLDDHDCWNIWVYEDTLAQPVVLDMPVDEQKLTKTDSATLSWNELCGADCYEVALWSYCAECPDQKLEIDLCLDCEPYDDVVCGDEIYCDDGCCPCTEDTCIVVDDLEPGTTYYWQIRVCQGKPRLSKWSEERSFTTALMAVPFVDLCSPACGSQDIILTPNFAWGAVEGATGYEVQLSTTETFTVGVVKGKTSVNAWVCPTTLEYATTYYWRVRAVKDTIYSDWTYCMFTTMAEPVPPTPPVVIEQVPPSAPPVINIPPAKMITPTWIYAMIGVGAALAIVVIVLIVRTRRPPA